MGSFQLSFNPPQFDPEYDFVKMNLLVEELERMHAVLTSEETAAGAGAVDSFNTRTGAVVPEEADYDAFFLTPAEGDAAYSLLSHNHTLSDVTDISATPAEVNLLDLGGLIAGWVLSADTATTASWKAPSGGSQTPWSSDIDGAGFGLDNIDRLEIQAPGVPGDSLTMTHDGFDFLFTFANTEDLNITGITSIQAGTVDADFDAITGTTFNGVAITTGGAATNYLDETGNYSAALSGGGATPFDIIGDINMATPPVTSSAFTALLRFTDNDETDVIGSIGYNANTHLDIVNMVDASDIRVYAHNTSDVLTQIGRWSAGSVATDYSKGSRLFLESVSVGHASRTSSFSTEDPPFRVHAGDPFTEDGQTATYLAMWGSGIIQAYSSGLIESELRLNVGGGNVTIGLPAFNHSIGSTLFITDNSTHVRNSSSTSPSTGATGDGVLGIYTSNGSPVFQLLTDSATNSVIISHDIHGQPFIIRAQDAGGTDTDIAYFSPVTGFLANLPDDNVVGACRVTTAGLGSFEVNNTLTGSGWERVITTGDGVMPPFAVNAMIYSNGTEWLNTIPTKLTWDGVNLNFGNAKKISFTDGLAVDIDLFELNASFTDGGTADVDTNLTTSALSTTSIPYVDVPDGEIDHANLVTGDEYLYVVTAVVGSSNTSNEENYVRCVDELDVLCVGSEHRYESSTPADFSGGVYQYCTKFTAAVSGEHNVQFRNSSGSSSTKISSVQSFVINITELGDAYDGAADATGENSAGLGVFVGSNAGITIGNGVDDYLIFHTNQNDKAGGAPVIGSAFWDGSTVYGESRRDTDASAGDVVQGGWFFAERLPAGTYFPCWHASTNGLTVEIHAINLSKCKEYYGITDLSTTFPADGTQYDYLTQSFTVINAGDWIALCGMSYEHTGLSGRNTVEWDINLAGANVVSGQLGGRPDDAALTPPGHFIGSLPNTVNSLSASDDIDAVMRILPGNTTPTAHEVSNGWMVAFLPIERVYVDDTLTVGDPAVAAKIEGLTVDINGLQAEVITTATTAELIAIANAVNTSAAKVSGQRVFNTTTGAPVWAVDDTDGGVWNDATGATAHTPV